MFRPQHSSARRPSGDTQRARPGRLVAVLGVSATALLVAGIAVSGASPAYAAEATVNLGTAESFAVLAGSGVSNTGPSVITGDLGVSPGSAVTGFPPGTVVDGTMHVSDAVALQAQDDVTTAYDDAAGRSTTVDVTGQDLGGMLVTAGVYAHSSGMQLTGTLTLDAQGDPAAVFIFKAGSTLVTASDSRVALVNGASPCNVFWQVGSSATLGTSTDFVGTVLALSSATLDTGATVEGRILARNGAVTLDDNLITSPSCAESPSPSPSESPTPSDDSGDSDDGSGDSDGDSDGGSDDGSGGSGGSDGSDGSAGAGSPDGGVSNPGPAAASGPSEPTIPSGHPETGLTPAGSGDRGPLVLFALAGLAGAGAVLASVVALRRPRQH